MAEEHEKPAHFHVTLLHGGVEAKLPASATREVALQTVIHFLGDRLSKLGLAELLNQDWTDLTSIGRARVDQCNCGDELITKQEIQRLLQEAEREDL